MRCGSHGCPAPKAIWRTSPTNLEGISLAPGQSRSTFQANRAGRSTILFKVYIPRKEVCTATTIDGMQRGSPPARFRPVIR